jgi:ABC-type glycerol-3-phosphate transport system substrate-binding protein
MKKLLILILSLVLALGLVACGNNSSDDELVGRWVSEYGSDWVTTFNADGTGSHSISWGYGTTFEWRTRGGNIRWSYSGHPDMDTPFEISEDTLYITVDDGTVFRYIRD